MQNYDKKELKEAVYQYIKEHKSASPSEITIALNISNGLDVLDVIEELRGERYIVLNTFPLTESNDSSVRFVATNKKHDCKS